MANPLGFLTYFPRLMRQFQTVTFSTHDLNASAAKAAWAFRAENAEAITHLGCTFSARTGTPPTYRISLQTIDASTGDPTGTVLGGGSPASKTFTPPADSSWNNTFQWFALDNSYTPSLGEDLCLVVDYSSGTVNASNMSTIIYGHRGEADQSFPFATINTSGTWSKQVRPPMFGVRTANTRYGNPWIQTLTKTATTTGNRVALKINVPTSTGISSFTIRRVSVKGTISGASSGKNPIIGIWSAAGVLLSNTLDTERIAGPTSSGMTWEIQLSGTIPTLAAGTDYYIGMECNDASSGTITVTTIDVYEADNRLAWEGTTNVCVSTYNGATWSDTTTQIPLIAIEFSDITYSGSLIIPPRKSLLYPSRTRPSRPLIIPGQNVVTTATVPIPAIRQRTQIRTVKAAERPVPLLLPAAPLVATRSRFHPAQRPAARRTFVPIPGSVTVQTSFVPMPMAKRVIRPAAVRIKLPPVIAPLVAAAIPLPSRRQTVTTSRIRPRSHILPIAAAVVIQNVDVPTPVIRRAVRAIDVRTRQRRVVVPIPGVTTTVHVPIVSQRTQRITVRSRPQRVVMPLPNVPVPIPVFRRRSTIASGVRKSHAIVVSLPGSTLPLPPRRLPAVSHQMVKRHCSPFPVSVSAPSVSPLIIVSPRVVR